MVSSFALSMMVEKCAFRCALVIGGVDRKALKARVVTCVFEEYRAGKYKVISFMAKRARGLMVRYAVEKKAVSVRKLEGFDAEGYRFDQAASAPDRLVFRRRQGL